jgi:hypothetical protein
MTQTAVPVHACMHACMQIYHKMHKRNLQHVHPLPLQAQQCGGRQLSVQAVLHGAANCRDSQRGAKRFTDAFIPAYIGQT